MTTIEKYTIFRPGCVEIPITLTCLSEEIWQDREIPDERLVELLVPYAILAIEKQIELHRTG